jgi:hypothetical protein
LARTTMIFQPVDNFPIKNGRAPLHSCLYSIRRKSCAHTGEISTTKSPNPFE